MTTDIRPGRAPGASGVTVAGVLAAMAVRYPPEWAQDWDRVGLVVGDPGAPVHRVLLAVDCVPETVGAGTRGRGGHDDRAPPTPAEGRAQRGDNDLQGRRRVHDLIRAGVSLLVAHTNTDDRPRCLRRAR